ncbi:MAG: hypothetical protein ACRD3R_00620 [Terriglobales bacterium]
MQSVLRKLMGVFAVAAFAASMSSVSAQSLNPGMVGSWKLNVEKSKYSPGPAPKSNMVTFEPAGAGVKVTTKGVNADGSPSATEYTANYDGKEVPMKGSATIDTVSLKRIDALTTVRTDKKGGKEVQTIRREIAKDGKTFTATIKGTNAKGEPVHNVLLLEKQ